MNLILCTLTWECVVLTGWIVTLVAVVVVMLVYFRLKHFVLPKMKDEHEKIMKEDAFNREKEWFFIKKTQKPLEEELKECQEKLEAFQKKETEMNEKKTL